jgi:hypothetical protein
MGQITTMNLNGDGKSKNGTASTRKEAVHENNKKNGMVPPANTSNQTSDLRPSPRPVRYAETAMNMALFDPPRWGWAAVGGIADVLPPHEVSLIIKHSELCVLVCSNKSSLPFAPSFT